MKRKLGSRITGGARKKARRADHVNQSDTATTSGPDHPVLRRLYPQVLTLRHYLVSQLPKCSKHRRRRISQLGLALPDQNHALANDADTGLAQLLDSTLVGLSSDAGTESSTHVHAEKERDREIEHFTQQRSQSTSGGTFKPGYSMQCEVGTTLQSQLHENARGNISKTSS
jgi:hypothetical protein